MKLRLDERRGMAAVVLDGRLLPLRRPVLAEWCDWQAEHERQTADLAAVLAGEASLEAALDDAVLRSGAASLNVRMLNATLLAPAPTVGPDDPLWLLLTDRHLTMRLLEFWRDWPLSPWVNAADAAEVAAVEDRELIRSNLPGVLGSRAVLYKALRHVAAPSAIDRMELWQIAVLLDRDAERDGPGPADSAPARSAAGPPGVPLFSDADDGGRRVRQGSHEVRRWRRKPGAPFLFSALAPPQ